jgi:hypothetical protein
MMYGRRWSPNLVLCTLKAVNYILSFIVARGSRLSTFWVLGLLSLLSKLILIFELEYYVCSVLYEDS